MNGQVFKMKIRWDFVTNSSSTMYVMYCIDYNIFSSSLSDKECIKLYNKMAEDGEAETDQEKITDIRQNCNWLYDPDDELTFCGYDYNKVGYHPETITELQPAMLLGNIKDAVVKQFKDDFNINIDPEIVEFFAEDVHD